MRDIYVTYVLGFGKFEAVYQTKSFTWFAIPLFSGIGVCSVDSQKYAQQLMIHPRSVGCLVQISYAYRIYTLRPSKPLYWIIVAVS